MTLSLRRAVPLAAILLSMLAAAAPIGPLAGL